MKIGIDISQIIYSGTGVANYTQNLVKNLQSENSDEFILFGSSLRNYDKLDNLSQIISGGKSTRKLFHFPQSLLNKLWNDLHIVSIENLIGKIDIFHSSDWLQPPTSAKKITTIHDLIVYKYPYLLHPKIVETHKRRLNWVKRECDLIIADSYSTKDDIQNILNIPDDLIEVVYPGINPIFKKSNEKEITDFKKKFNILGDYILSVGTIEPRKNLRRLLVAFEYFSKHPLIKSLPKPVELLLIGKSGWQELPPLPQFVKRLGFMSEDLLPVIYSGAHMFIYPSLYEGFGLPILEAMACDVPVITSNRGSLKEVSGDACIFVDPENTIDISKQMIQLYTDNKKRNKLKNLGSQRVKLFSWNKTARQTLEIYRKIYNEKNIK